MRTLIVDLARAVGGRTLTLTLTLPLPLPLTPSLLPQLRDGLDLQRLDLEIWGDMGRCGEMWGDMGRCGEMWGDSQARRSCAVRRCSARCSR